MRAINLLHYLNLKFVSGTIMATLTRKSKSMELLTKEEMITYHKGNNIPTSHIQLHDPESVTAAVNIFRVSGTGTRHVYLFHAYSNSHITKYRDIGCAYYYVCECPKEKQKL